MSAVFSRADEHKAAEDMAVIIALMSAFHEIAVFVAEDTGKPLPRPTWTAEDALVEFFTNPNNRAEASALLRAGA